MQTLALVAVNLKQVNFILSHTNAMRRRLLSLLGPRLPGAVTGRCGDFCALSLSLSLSFCRVMGKRVAPLHSLSLSLSLSLAL